jgi:hypothetical protein
MKRFEPLDCMKDRRARVTLQELAPSRIIQRLESVQHFRGLTQLTIAAALT